MFLRIRFKLRRIQPLIDSILHSFVNDLNTEALLQNLCKVNEILSLAAKHRTLRIESFCCFHQVIQLIFIVDDVFESGQRFQLLIGKMTVGIHRLKRGPEYFNELFSERGIFKLISRIFLVHHFLSLLEAFLQKLFILFIILFPFF